MKAIQNINYSPVTQHVGLHAYADDVFLSGFVVKIKRLNRSRRWANIHYYGWVGKAKKRAQCRISNPFSVNGDSRQWLPLDKSRLPTVINYATLNNFTSQDEGRRGNRQPTIIPFERGSNNLDIVPFLLFLPQQGNNLEEMVNLNFQGRKKLCYRVILIQFIYTTSLKQVEEWTDGRCLDVRVKSSILPSDK